MAPEALWQTANALKLTETRALGPLIRWRIPGLPARLTYGELFRAYPFVVVDEGERHLVAGLCGRIWTLARDYPRLDGPQEFAAWDEPGTVRVVFGHWVEEAGVDAAGDTGESEPAQAIEDALATFAADRIVIFSHTAGKDYREEEGLADAEQRFGLPVTHAEIAR